MLKGAALLRVCAVGSPVRAGSARPRPARARPTPRQGTVGALSLLGAWGQPACARYAPNSLSCAYTARLAGGTRERVCFARDRSRAASAVGARSCDSHSSGQWQLAVRSGWLCVFVAWLCVYSDQIKQKQRVSPGTTRLELANLFHPNEHTEIQTARHAARAAFFKREAGNDSLTAATRARPSHKSAVSRS